jgi:hypothetical protein
MVPENFIAMIAQGNGAEARAVLEDGLSNIVLNRLEERKRGLAAGLFSGTSTQPVTEENEAAEKHDDEVEDTKLVKKLVKKDCLTKEEVEQLDEISLKTKKSAYAKSVEMDSPRGDRLAVKIEKNVQKKHGSAGVERLYKAADTYMYGNRKNRHN